MLDSFWSLLGVRHPESMKPTNLPACTKNNQGEGVPHPVSKILPGPNTRQAKNHGSQRARESSLNRNSGFPVMAVLVKVGHQ